MVPAIIGTMEDKHFDDQIRKAFEHFEAPGKGGEWDAFLDKMNAASLDPGDAGFEQAFDRVLRDRFRGFEVPQQSGHWQRMASRIREEFSLHGMLVRYKVGEVAVMLLLLLTIVQFLPAIQQKDHHSPKAPSEWKRGIPAGEVPFPADIREHPATLENLPQAQLLEPVKGSVEPAHSSESRRVAELVAPDLSGYATGQDPDYLKNELKSVASVSHREGRIPATRQSLPEPGLLSSSMLLAIDLHGAKRPLQIALPEIELLRKPRELRFSMFSGLDINYIKTPRDEIFFLPEYSRFAGGYGAGVTAGLKFGKFEFETGGIYASRQYKPRIPTELVNLQGFGLSDVRFDKIQMNLLQVPVNIRYHFARARKWRFYGQTGASLHLAVQADYDRFPSTLGSLSQSFEGRPPRLEEKNFPDGLLEGGNFEENSYFSANLGLGVEHLLNTRWSVFFQPNLQAYILPGYNNGLGPNQDRISTLSILTGARVNIWR